MHELAIAEDILRIVRTELAARKIEKAVSSVLFRAGKLNAVVPETLSFHFDVLKTDEPLLKTASLEVQEVPLQVRCLECGIEATLEEPILICLKCGSALSIESKQGMWVEKISLRED
ncbi:MAG: hydrogenase maturation nickel metallochaperone HypA [Pseudomonadota bacterium]